MSKIINGWCNIDTEFWFPQLEVIYEIGSPFNSIVSEATLVLQLEGRICWLNHFGKIFFNGKGSGFRPTVCCLFQ
jgi:hypothetical protein